MDNEAITELAALRHISSNMFEKARSFWIDRKDISTSQMQFNAMRDYDVGFAIYNEGTSQKDHDNIYFSDDAEVVNYKTIYLPTTYPQLSFIEMPGNWNHPFWLQSVSGITPVVIIWYSTKERKDWL